jgi:hypothetical protein
VASPATAVASRRAGTLLKDFSIMPQTNEHVVDASSCKRGMLLSSDQFDQRRLLARSLTRFNMKRNGFM